ncbi:hypothetical protein EBR21_17170, partial [bacterium]|nr:hypothetical protein [bacterium]
MRSVQKSSRLGSEKFMQWMIFCAVVTISACQPVSRQDRAMVGPESTPTAAADQQSQTDPSAQNNGDAGNSSAGGLFASAGVSTQWETTMRTQCDLGRPAACSSLAYEASRSQRLTAAIELFKRACLMDQSPVQCSAAGSDSKGSARSCVELSKLLQQQGQAEDARKFRLCACERN